jgi:AcrR family transcriptional regulator
MSEIIDLDSRRTRPTGRIAMTERGGKVMDEVTAAARKLLVHDWSYEVSVVAVAREAGVARASLLWQFEAGMPDILNTVLIRELTGFDEGFAKAERQRNADPLARTLTAFSPLFAQAETSGRLYANLRGAMFTWGTQNSDIYSKSFNDYIDMTVELLKGAAPSSEPLMARLEGHIAKAVFSGCLDSLANGVDAESGWKERQEAFRSIVIMAVEGMRQLARNAKARRLLGASQAKRRAR